MLYHKKHNIRSFIITHNYFYHLTFIQEFSMDSDSDSSVLTEEEATVTCLFPYAVIVANLPKAKIDSYYPLKKKITRETGLKCENVISAMSRRRNKGYAILTFGETPDAFKAAMRLHETFRMADHGKEEFEQLGEKEGPYLWIARPGDEQWFKRNANKYESREVPESWAMEAYELAIANDVGVFHSISVYTKRFEYATAAQLRC